MACAWCERVKVADIWVAIVRNAMNESIGLNPSHGICPQWAKKLYGEFLKKTPLDPGNQ